MQELIKLNNTQKHFAELIYKTVAVNPFSPDAVKLEQKLCGKSHNKSGVELSKFYISQIDNFFEPFDKNLGRPARVSDFSHSVEQNIYYTICYRVFHEYVERIDELVACQLKQPEGSCTVGFADELIKKLAVRGIELDNAARVLSYFYQLRRAWLFISGRLKGNGPSMMRMREDIWNNIFTHNVEIYEKKLWYRMEDFSTLLLGGTGSGKGAAAQAIGFSSYIPYDAKKRQFDISFMKNFVPVNLSQFPETLLESELFGHARGAFTGATESYDGLFARCGQYGTIFLDEIAEIKLHTQVKLLKVLEERLYCPLGSHKLAKFQGRVIAATHQPIDDLCEMGRFRDDLYYRLCSDVIYVPSLRQRLDEEPGELELMVGHLLDGMVGAGADDLKEVITRRLTKELPGDYSWPGNVRELAQLIRRIIIKSNCKLETRRRSGDGESPAVGLNMADYSGECSVAELTEQYCRNLYHKYENYQVVAKITGLNWRTIKKYCE